MSCNNLEGKLLREKGIQDLKIHCSFIVAIGSFMSDSDCRLGMLCLGGFGYIVGYVADWCLENKN